MKLAFLVALLCYVCTFVCKLVVLYVMWKMQGVLLSVIMHGLHIHSNAVM